MSRFLSRPLLGAAIMLAATIAVNQAAAIRRPARLAQPLASIEKRIGAWNLSGESTIASSVLSRLSPTEYISRIYSKEDRQAALLITYFSHQRAGETMHSPRVCLPGNGWEIWQHDTAVIRSGGREYRVNKHRIQNAGVRMLVIYWYQSGDRVIHSEYTGKLLLLKDSLWGRRTDASLVRLVVPDTERASADALELAGFLIPRLQRCFG